MSFQSERLYVHLNGVRQPIGPEDPELRAYHESLVSGDYDLCHADDSFEDLKGRARFSKEDKMRLLLWMDVAEIRAASAYASFAQPIPAAA